MCGQEPIEKAHRTPMLVIESLARLDKGLVLVLIHGATTVALLNLSKAPTAT
ncbi:MAG: hypothetical protein ABI413_15535 [Ktedonobacteraceae bacterium]